MINELDKKSLPLVTFEVPNGERPDTYFEGYFGALPMSAADMPSEADVEATVFIDFTGKIFSKIINTGKK